MSTCTPPVRPTAVDTLRPRPRHTAWCAHRTPRTPVPHVVRVCFPPDERPSEETIERRSHARERERERWRDSHSHWRPLVSLSVVLDVLVFMRAPAPSCVRRPAELHRAHGLTRGDMRERRGPADAGATFSSTCHGGVLRLSLAVNVSVTCTCNVSIMYVRMCGDL